jgi:hypothetical protein
MAASTSSATALFPWGYEELVWRHGNEAVEDDCCAFVPEGVMETNETYTKAWWVVSGYKKLTQNSNLKMITLFCGAVPDRRYAEVRRGPRQENHVARAEELVFPQHPTSVWKPQDELRPPQVFFVLSNYSRDICHHSIVARRRTLLQTLYSRTSNKC